MKIVIPITCCALLVLSNLVNAKEAIKRPCRELEFFKKLENSSNDSASLGQPTLASKEVYKIIANSKVGKIKLPPWAYGYFTDLEFSGDCKLYKGDEWVVRGIFKPHGAPEGFGDIFVNLTTGGVFLVIFRDNFINQKDVTEVIYQEGSDDYLSELIENLSDSNFR